ncbi:MAG: class I SAM-dependent methyltransferase [Thermoplasmata archaeon]|nr:class I SAM-dependent methyltransferase [Thermoplasmata archaeon]
MDKVEPFDRYADRYEDWFGGNRFAYESELLAVKRLLPESGVGVEVGVGTGRFAEPLGIKIGVDPSARMGEVARRRGIEVIAGVGENLPFRDSQFDFVLFVTTICFLDDVERALKEAYRVLKPGGATVIGFVDKNSPLGKSYQQRKGENVFYSVATFLSVEEVVRDMERVGFKDFTFAQTIFQSLAEIDDIEPVREGYGEGSFVVVKGLKRYEQKI